ARTSLLAVQGLGLRGLRPRQLRRESSPGPACRQAYWQNGPPQKSQAFFGATRSCMANKLEFPADPVIESVHALDQGRPAAAPAGAAPSLYFWLLSAICAVGFLLRWHALAATSFWIDEGMSAMIIRLPWSEFVALMKLREGNMALYYLLLRGWTQLGDS